MEFCDTKKDNVAMNINQCCFYGNIFAILSQIFLHIVSFYATCSNILSAFLHIATNSKSIQSIFIKFSELI